MPHITVDYAPRLDGVFDRRAFAEELDPLVVERVQSAGVCKMFFRRAAETFVAGRHDAAFVHVEIGLLRGRAEGRKSGLADAVLALLARHVPAPPGAEPVLSVEVRDLAASYRLGRPAGAPEGGRRPGGQAGSGSAKPSWYAANQARSSSTSACPSA